MLLDTLFTNGQIHTGVAGAAVASRLGVIGGRIVGLDDDLDGVSARNTVDLDGQTIVPGFNDAHRHLVFHGFRLMQLNLRPERVSTLADFLEAVRLHAATLAPDAWIIGGGYDQNIIGRHPTAEELDAVSGGRPAWLSHVSEHMGVGNSKAFALAGWSDRLNVPEIEGGFVERDSTGRAVGLLQEKAQAIIVKALPSRTTADVLDAIATGGADALSNGITSFTDPGLFSVLAETNEFGDVAVYQDALELGILPLRANLMPYITSLHSLPFSSQGGPGFGLDHGMRTGLGNEWLRIGGTKVLSDGSLIGRSAFMCCDYHGEPGNRGLLQFAEGDLNDWLRAAHRSGWQIAAHAIGDGAINTILDILEQANAEHPRANARHRIEHFGVSSPEQVARAAALGIVPVPQPHFVSEFGDGMIAALGQERADWAYRGQSLLDAGIVVPGSSDAPVANGSALFGIHDAVNRRTASGAYVGRTEAVSVEDAVRSFTYGSAFASHEERIKGTLRRGMLADFVALSQDIFTVEHDAIREVAVTKTIIGGEVAYAS
ncbi:amidohydrolase [Lysinibacter cavernae]|uniref:Amidohydrolase 3 domain-containing protein n=1 Tax=Lysinibacter cavernae TaxID=1640652 RepID=A0A7X5TU27_9MICO|nr:amidohydrolase [Lysinibacter cavernae]NIH53197.1 hypothetical protein [Lysinibacter cavernae]